MNNQLQPLLPQYISKNGDKWMVCRLCDGLVCRCWESFNLTCPNCGDKPNLCFIQSMDDDGFLTCYKCELHKYKLVESP
jgi:hypothetical protein